MIVGQAGVKALAWAFLGVLFDGTDDPVNDAYTFAGAPTGDAVDGRVLVVCAAGATGGGTPTTVTAIRVNGVACTLHQPTANIHEQLPMAIGYIELDAIDGSTATIVIDFASAALSRCDAGVFVIYGPQSAAPTAVYGDGTDTLASTVSPSISGGGVAFLIGHCGTAPTTVSWSAGVTEHADETDYDGRATIIGSMIVSGVATATWNATTICSLIAAAWR